MNTLITVSKEIVAKVEDKVLETYIKAEEIWKRQFELPRLQFDLRGCCAGRAAVNIVGLNPSIQLNPILLNNNESNFIETVIPHEVAHLLTNRLFGFWVKPHGREWKSVMVALGLQPIRCHNYDVSNAQVRRIPSGRRERRFIYACACRSIQETARSHFKLQSGEIKYQGPCKYCGEDFKFKPDMGNRETLLNAQAKP